MSTPSITRNKDKYKVRNREAYNSSLCKRGSLTLWLNGTVLEEREPLSRKGKEAGEVTCSDSIIQCCLLLKISHGLKLRQCTGFLNIFKLTGQSDLPVPDYTTLCRRQRILPVSISERLNRGERLDMGIDSTGLKVCGEGEWKVRKHGYSKHRTWRKLHICTDLTTQEILSARLTENSEDDANAAIRMLQGKTGKIKRFAGDGACDKFGLREVFGKDIEQVIPPPENAVIQKGKRDSPLPGYLIQRNEAVEHIHLHGSRSWKQVHGYHQRGLNEAVMFRYKTVFGSG